MTAIYVLLDLNNVSIDRLYAFDILRCGPIRLSSGSSTSGRVTRAPGLPSFLFVFHFLLKWSCGLQGCNSFLEGDVLSSTFTFRWVICHFLPWPVFTLICLGSNLIT